MRWELQLALGLARNDVNDVEETCYDNSTGPLLLSGRYEGALLPGMEKACPYESVLRCKAKGARAAGEFSGRACTASPY